MRNPDAGDRCAYIGRGFDDEFFGYVTDVATGQEVFEEGEWSDVESALVWARARADQVVLTYGGKRDAVFSAGVTQAERDGMVLPVWPPSADARRAIDRAVEESDRPRAPMPGELGVARPMVVRDDTQKG